jgi:hypothetical protein
MTANVPKGKDDSNCRADKMSAPRVATSARIAGMHRAKLCAMDRGWLSPQEFEAKLNLA